MCACPTRAVVFHLLWRGGCCSPFCVCSAPVCHLAPLVRLPLLAVSRLTQSDRDRVLSLEDRLRARVIGQEEAVKSVASAILRSRAGMSKEGQPQGAFMFLVRACAPC